MCVCVCVCVCVFAPITHIILLLIKSFKHGVSALGWHPYVCISVCDCDEILEFRFIKYIFIFFFMSETM